MNLPCVVLLLALPCDGDLSAVAAQHYAPQPGDILLFQHHNPAVRLIYTLSFCGTTTHAAIVVARENGVPALLEPPTMGSHVMINDVAERLTTTRNKAWVRRRRTPLSPAQSARLTAFALAQAGKPYDFPALLLPPITSPVRPPTSQALTARDLDRSTWMCSELVVAAGIIAELLDPHVVRPRYTCAHDLMTDMEMDISAGWEAPVVLITGPQKK